MKKSLAVLAVVGLATAASAQSWQFELSELVLRPGAPLSTTVTLSVDHPAGDYAFAAANLSVSATRDGWSDPVALLGLGAPPSGGHPGQAAGVISGADVTGISVGQLASFGWEPTPGRIDVWRATYTATDFSTHRFVELSTETSRFEVYTDPFPATARETRTPTEARARIEIIPAPASLALLGVGGLAAARRRR